jgi:hypothetical protein
MAAATGGVRPGRSRSTSSWPRAAHCSTASPRAARQSGCTGTPSAALADQAIRSRPGSAPGKRIEPPRSLPWAMGTKPAATAAADPPLPHDQLLVVATGTFCSYTPPEPTPWRVSQEEGPPVPR